MIKKYFEVIGTGKAEAAQKRLFRQGVYFNSKERSFVQLALKVDGKYCCCMKNTSGGRCTMTNSSSSSSSYNSIIYTMVHNVIQQQIHIPGTSL